MFLRIKPVAFSVLFGIKKWAAAAACLESASPRSAPAGSLQTVGRVPPENKGPLTPKISSLYPFPAAVSDIGPASVLPPIAAGALNQPRHLLQSPCLFQPVYFCFAGPRQEEGACDAFELCPNKMLKQPWEDISQVWGQHHPGRGSPGNSQGTEPLVTKVFLPSSPCRGMTQAWLPSPSLSLL